jgi:hypothetical protein
MFTVNYFCSRIKSLYQFIDRPRTCLSSDHQHAVQYFAESGDNSGSRGLQIEAEVHNPIKIFRTLIRILASIKDLVFNWK